MDQSNHQGWYGECFIRALGAAAGLQVSRKEPDVTGTDFQIATPHEIDGDFSEIRAQVKSWSTPRAIDDVWSYPRLDQKSFNALAGRRRIPTFLFLVIVPPDSSHYSHANEDRLQLSHAAYWVSLADRKKIDEANREKKITIHIPRENLLTADTLLQLCEDADSPEGAIA